MSEGEESVRVESERLQTRKVEATVSDESE
jgi:hypothetical protein